jgi:UDP-2,3-diacylglucosamine hydrolase
MSTKTKIYFASDFHLGAPNHSESVEREKKIISWLNRIEKDAQAIYLVGDIFDVWYEWKHTIPKGYVRLLGKLAEICDSGIPIHFFTGNHDLWTFGYLEKEIGLQVHRHPIQIELQGRKLYVGHGDGLGPGDKKYKLLKKVFTSKICQWFFSRLHPNVSFALANYFSSSSRISKSSADEKFKGEDEEWLFQYSKEMLASEHYDYFIFGHRHLPLDIDLSKKSKYINLGEWIHYNSFAVLENGNLDLQFFESSFSKAINK